MKEKLHPTTQLNITFPMVTVDIPEDKLIIDKEAYENLQKEAEQGRYLTLNDVLEMLSVSRPWLLDNVLYNPKFRSEIDIDRNPNGFVKYPKNQGERYYFLASKTRRYFEHHFKDIFN